MVWMHWDFVIVLLLPTLDSFYSLSPAKVVTHFVPLTKKLFKTPLRRRGILEKRHFPYNSEPTAISMTTSDIISHRLCKLNFNVARIRLVFNIKYVLMQGETLKQDFRQRHHVWRLPEMNIYLRKMFMNRKAICTSKKYKFITYYIEV